MRFAGSIGLDVSEIAFVTFSRHRAAMLMLSRVKVRTRGGGIGRGAIALFMNVEPMLARLQSSDFADHLHVVAHFGEGHHAGDLLLQYTAGILRNSIASADFVARIGGDEFVAIVRFGADSPVVGSPLHVGCGTITAP